MIHNIEKVALYARYSSDNQRSESIDAQLRAMRVYCKQHNFIIVNTYIDEAKSAMTDRRPAFQQMIADSAGKTFNILLVHKLDRFARNRYDSAVYKRELKKNGVLVYSVLENLDNSPESVMMEAVLDGISEYYSKNLSREVMKGMKETALQCKHTGGTPPLGFDVDEKTKKLVINPLEAETVKIIYDMYSEGYGYSEILERLHYEGRKTKRGTEFQKNSLTSILNNPKYVGVFVFNRSNTRNKGDDRSSCVRKTSEDIISIDGGCPQIVDRETYEKVRERMSEHGHTGGKNNAKTNYLLSGKVFCSECGRAMNGNLRFSGRNKAQYITYRCPSKSYNCTNKEINRDYLEEYVVKLLEQHIFNMPSLRKLKKQIESYMDVCDNKHKEEKIREELEEVKIALSNVADAVAAGLISEALIERLNELETKKAELEEELMLNGRAMEYSVIDPPSIMAEYKKQKSRPMSPAYKEFITAYVGEIKVGKYSVDVTLKTGLGVFSELDMKIEVRRRDIYEKNYRLNV